MNSSLARKVTLTSRLSVQVRPLIELLQQGLQAVERSGVPLSPGALAPVLTNMEKNVEMYVERAKTATPGLPKTTEHLLE